MTSRRDQINRLEAMHLQTPSKVLSEPNSTPTQPEYTAVDRLTQAREKRQQETDNA